MTRAPTPPPQDPNDDAPARAWVEEVLALADAGELTPDNEYLERKLAEEKRSQKDP
ncbi:MAG: hypothetical protein JO265_06630 [Acidimicrobiia bacterium]|nr:hypothetical protein [Acidimicrobiia bacterium]